jgi:2,4-dienoyl-CoA reductase-like NADH-dependent reductase (Old Yellow Enzyme family)
MAPMTRSRAINNLPNDLMAEYYGQRTVQGLSLLKVQHQHLKRWAIPGYQAYLVKLKLKDGKRQHRQFIKMAAKSFYS